MVVSGGGGTTLGGRREGWGRMGDSWLEGSWVVVVAMESEQRSCEVWKIWWQFGGVWEVEGGSTSNPNFPG